MKKLTATQLDLLRAVAAGLVTHSPSALGYPAEDTLRIPGSVPRRVTSRIWHMQRARLVTCLWELTDAGRAYLDAADGAR